MFNEHFRVGYNCKINSILEVWSYNKSMIAHLTYNDIMRDINTVKYRWVKQVLNLFISKVYKKRCSSYQILTF